MGTASDFPRLNSVDLSYNIIMLFKGFVTTSNFIGLKITFYYS